MTLLRSWSPIPRGSHFSLANIPFGIITTTTSSEPRVATAIGDNAFDLAAFAAHNGFSALSAIQPFQSVFSEPTLNSFAALGQPIHSVVRKYIQDIFLASTSYPTILKENKELQEICLIPLKDVRNHMPFHIGDYTDFYAGLNHASNCSKIFNRPMQPNYKHLPVAYHGRASSVVVSGTPIRRPSGQILPEPGQPPVFSACKKLDFELELGCFVCKGNKMGEPIDVNEAEAHLFGVVMMNDWSARDIQKWEMVPLGPLNSKNFGTTISPWVVLTEALQPFLAQGIPNDQQLLPYLQEMKKDNIVDIKLSVDITTNSGNTKTVCRTSSRNLLYSFSQMLAHHTIGGCPFNVGDLMGSGTISSQDREGFGALLEITDDGKTPIGINGELRTFLEDGDTITFTGLCGDDEEGHVGFGTCTGTILPAVRFTS